MITSITMTRAQRESIDGIKIFSDAWFERLADITECPPETLRERIPDTVFIDYIEPATAKTKAKRGWKRSISNRDRDILWIITPIPQKVSGVLKYIE